MTLGRPNLGSILLANGTITEAQLQEGMNRQRITGKRLGDVLVEIGACTDGDIARSLAEQLELPFVDLAVTPPVPELVALIPREQALKHRLLPVYATGNKLVVAVDNPFDIRNDEVVRRATNMQMVPAIAPDGQFRNCLRRYYENEEFNQQVSLLGESLADWEFTGQSSEQDAEPAASVEELLSAGEQNSTIMVVNALIADAVQKGASDLHIEPQADFVRVRYRIDGELRVGTTLQRRILHSVVARIKIMCGMDIAESRSPQDGGCGVRLRHKEIEIRASTLPGVHGEYVVLRLLNKETRLQRVDALGFSQQALRDMRRLLTRRQGMLLVTGPTGSGKTTTLYASLSHLNREEVKIITVEDPVEQKLPGISQIQVNERAGRTFASTLRAMLRQDPDVIMVGEIRDSETADIACRAALTGHLVLSTLHTPHAIGTLARLQDMGVPSYIMAAVLHGVLAQRLVRKNCEACVAPYDPPSHILRTLEAQHGRPPFPPRFQKGRGCPQCFHTGLSGRVGVYELLLVDEALRSQLFAGVSPSVLGDFVRQRGFVTMEGDAYHKACQGLIPVEEVLNLGLGDAIEGCDAHDGETGGGHEPASPREYDLDDVEYLDEMVIAGMGA